MLGEETVLLAALEGKRGQPEQRPPYPDRARPVRATRPSSTTWRPSPPCPGSSTNGADAFRAIGDPEAPGHRPRRRSPGPSPPRASPRSPTGTTAPRDRRSWPGAWPRATPLKARPRRRTRPAASCRPSSLDTPYTFAALRATRRPRRVGRRSSSPTSGPASWTSPGCSSATAPTRPAARRSPAGSACAASRRSASAIADGTARPTDLALLADLAADCAASALCDHERLAPAPLLTGDAILPARDRRAHPAGHLPRRRLQPDRARGRRPARKVGDDRTMADLISRPADLVPVDPPRAGRRQPRRAALPDPGAPAAAVDARPSGWRSTAGSSRAARARRSWRSAATTGSRSRPSATSPSCRASAPAGCASWRWRARSTRRSRARAPPRPGWSSGPRPRRSAASAGRTWS